MTLINIKNNIQEKVINTVTDDINNNNNIIGDVTHNSLFCPD